MSFPQTYRWLFYALLGALFAAIVSVLNKKALNKTELTAALAVQVTPALLTVGVLLVLQRGWRNIGQTPTWAWGLLALSGIASGLSWFFGYRALQLTDVAKSTPIDKISLPIGVILAMIFLSERPSGLNWAGVGLMFAGAICVARG